jgi:hypothetical protein
MNRDLNTPLWQLTLGDLLDAIQKLQQPEPPKVEDYTGDRYVYHISGIAKLFGCSKTTVNVYRRNGWLEPAIKQYGRKIVCDASLALELFGKHQNQ